MPWYNDGDWAALWIRQTKHPMAEMCYAMNEREEFCYSGSAHTTWTSPAKQYPVADDFQGHRAPAEWVTIEEIRASIENIIAPDGGTAVFVNPETGQLWDSLEELLTAAGFGASWIAKGRVPHTDVLLQLKAVIELLKYVLDEVSPTIISSTQYSGSNSSGGPFLTQQAAYENALANRAWTGAGFGLSSGCTAPHATPIPYTVDVTTQAIWNIGTASPSRTVVGWRLRYEHITAGRPVPDAMVFSDTVNTFTASGSAASEYIYSVWPAESLPSLPATLTLTWDYPEDHPFPAMVQGDSGTRQVWLSQLKFITVLDIGTDLTYG